MTQLRQRECFEQTTPARARTIPLALAAVVLSLPLACHPGRNLGPAADITDAELWLRHPSCVDYAGHYTSRAKDVHRSLLFEGSLSIKKVGDTCEFNSNAIPNHDFNDGSTSFVNPVKAVQENYRIPVRPVVADTRTELSVAFDNAIFLNGIKLDLLAAACYGVGGEPRGHEKIGCFDDSFAWRYDPMYARNDFRADTHHAHAQPDGAYHYHGSPRALFDDTPTEPSPVIGFAADGFPIYGPYINDQGVIRKARSGYTLRQGARQPLSDEEKKKGKVEAAFPGGEYNGRFRDDYVFTNAGDLDECNGMLRDGQYGYYVTDTYPWVMGCFRGTPDKSFKKPPLPEQHPH